MLDERIVRQIREANPWWAGAALEVPPYKRRLFSELERYLPKKQIVEITGLRRVGKTTLMRQLAKKLLEEGNPGENVFFFAFDGLIARTPEVLEDVTRHYLQKIAKEGKKYVFFDEIQKVPYWQDVLKRFYDSREDVKFIVSGSATLQIKRSKESLAGRLMDFHLPPLTFPEFVEMSGVQAGNPALEFKALSDAYERLLPKKERMESLFAGHLISGGFPELAGSEDGPFVRAYITNSVIEKVLYEDIPESFDIRRRDLLYALIEYACKETAQLFDVTNLAKILKVNYDTVSSYVFYLQNAFLVHVAYNYSKSLAKQMRKSKKLHIAHPSLAFAMLGYDKAVLGMGEAAGRYVETAVFSHFKTAHDRIHFWRDPAKVEVDIVLESGGSLLPIEVKYKNRIEKEDLAGLLKFCKKFKVEKGIVATKDRFERQEADGKEILLVPVWLLLLAQIPV